MMRSVVLLVCGLAMVQGFPATNEERSALIQEQADENYKHHQEVIGNKDYSSTSLDNKGGYNSDGSFGITFDNNDKEHRDRGYGYEKAYAYSRETAYIDFVDDKGALDARGIVEKYGKSDDEKSEDLLANISH